MSQVCSAQSDLKNDTWDHKEVMHSKWRLPVYQYYSRQAEIEYTLTSYIKLLLALNYEMSKWLVIKCITR